MQRREQVTIVTQEPAVCQAAHRSAAYKGDTERPLPAQQPWHVALSGPGAVSGAREESTAQEGMQCVGGIAQKTSRRIPFLN